MKWIILFVFLMLVFPLKAESDMGIKELFNPIGSGVKVQGSLSNLFGGNKSPVQPAVPASYNLKDRGVSVTDNDLNALRPLVYGEVSNRAPEKQTLEANVIVNTALNRAREYGSRGKNLSVSDVVAMPNQYQAYGGKQYQEYHNPSDPVALAKKKQVDLILDGISKQIKSGQYPDNTEGAYYYVHNPDKTITYDNKRPLFAK